MKDLELLITTPVTSFHLFTFSFPNGRALISAQRIANCGKNNKMCTVKVRRKCWQGRAGIVGGSVRPNYDYYCCYDDDGDDDDDDEDHFTRGPTCPTHTATSGSSADRRLANSEQVADVGGISRGHCHLACCVLTVMIYCSVRGEGYEFGQSLQMYIVTVQENPLRHV